MRPGILFASIALFAAGCSSAAPPPVAMDTPARELSLVGPRGADGPTGGYFDDDGAVPW